MNYEKILSMVESNFGGYESISLANDDVERLLIILRYVQKQSDLLTLGLLQEKDKVRKLTDVLTLILNENFAGQSRLSPYAKRQADEVLKEKPLGTEMADAFDKIIESTDTKPCSKKG